MTLTSRRHVSGGAAPASEFDSILQRVMEAPVAQMRAKFAGQETQIAAVATAVNDLVTRLEGLSALDGVAANIGNLQASVAHVSSQLYALRGSVAGTESRLSEMDRLLAQAREHDQAVAETNTTITGLRRLVMVLTAAVTVQLMATGLVAARLFAG